MNRKTAMFSAGLTLLLAACGHVATTPLAGPGPALAATAAKSAKRGVAYDLTNAADQNALAPGTGWWYNWSPTPNAGASLGAGMEFVPMIWNGSFDTVGVESSIRRLGSKYVLVLNEPNLTGQANLTPQQAADLWPRYEQVARDTGVKIVGPQITWGTMSGYSDPVAWLDAFYSAYWSKNGGRDPQIDALGFHWYDYGLAAQLDRLKKYGKPFWVTEFANWHSGDGSAQIDSVAKQKAQMADMVGTLEGRADVLRYAWFTGRWNNDTHFSSLLAGTGQLTELGQSYLSLPFSGSATGGGSPCGTSNAALNRPALSSSNESNGLTAAGAFDGNAGTRWSSAFADPQWLQVDLGSAQTVCGVTLAWEAAYGRAFRIEVSNDAQSWTKVYETAAGTGGTQTLTTTAARGRYVRLTATQRATAYGDSLWEMQVFVR